MECITFGQGDFSVFILSNCDVDIEVDVFQSVWNHFVRV